MAKRYIASMNLVSQVGIKLINNVDFKLVDYVEKNGILAERKNKQPEIPQVRNSVLFAENDTTIAGGIIMDHSAIVENSDTWVI